MDRFTHDRTERLASGLSSRDRGLHRLCMAFECAEHKFKDKSVLELK